MITRLQNVLSERPVEPDPAPDTAIIVIVYYDAQDHVCYWAGLTNGHDGQGWTAERKEAMEFTTWSSANQERNRAKHAHPLMRVTLQGSWMGGGE
jgi:hypothetical protein